MFLFFCTQKVVVDINDITSSCKNDQCGFTYKEESTPVIQSITPLTGFGATVCKEVTVQCTGCSNDAENNTVVIGDVVCNVTMATGSEVKCCLGMFKFAK